MSTGTIEGVAVVEDGKIDESTIALCEVNGVHFQACCDILDTLGDAFGGKDSELSGQTGCVHFTVKNIVWFEGQQSFPETGQWDIPPDWEYDVEITKIDS